MEMDHMMCSYESCSCVQEQEQSCSKCENGLSVLVGIIGGIVFTAVVVLLFINGFLTTLGFSGWVALISALVYLAGTVALSAVSEKAKVCIRCSLGSLVFGIFGTIFSGYLSIAADITAGAIFPAVIAGLTAFFFAYMVISTLFLIKCLVKS